MLFLHPVKFMEEGEFENGSWLPVVILITILAALHYVMLPELLATYDAPGYVTQFAERAQITESAAKDQIVEMRRIAPYMGLIESPLMVSAGIAGVAAVLYLIGRLQYRKSIAFKSLYSMVAWGSLVSAAPLLINLFARMIQPDLSLSTNAAALLPDSMQGSYFYNIFLVIDPFLVWQIWLMGLGMANLCEVNRQRAVSSVGTMFVILSIFFAWTMTLAAKLNV